VTKKSYSFPYSADYNPSMPMIEVGISLLQQTQPAITIMALVDSGSDASLLPVSVFDLIRAIPVDKVRIRGILGQSYPANLYSVNIYIGTHRLFARQIAGVNSTEDILIGRNVLNQLEVILNGPASTTEIII
jgi:predicted aspartyl protease